MATLAELRATIDDDLIATPVAVTDTQIDDAIKQAIRDYESTRFWFNESRSITFATVVGQTDYSGDSDVALVMHADYLVLELSGADRRLRYSDPNRVSWLIEGDESNGEPYLWTYFGGAIRLFPAPDAVYTVRVTGFIKYAELTSGAENVWTVKGKGYDLIRARAKWHIASNLTKDKAEAGRASAAEEVARDAAMRSTGQRTSRNCIRPRQF